MAESPELTRPWLEDEGTRPSPSSPSNRCTSPEAGMFRSLLARMGDKWTLYVISTLGERRLRFTELADLIPGISRRMLTVTLRALERDGLVTRTVYAEVPVRVEYEITDLGRSLQQVVLRFGDWIWEHQNEIITHRDDFDARARR